MKLLQADLCGITKMQREKYQKQQIKFEIISPYGLSSMDSLIQLCLIAFFVGHIIFVFPVVCFSFSNFKFGEYIK